MAPIAFTIPGPPVPKARARVVNGHAYTPKHTKDYEAKVRALALVARQKARQRVWTGPVSITMRFFLSGKATGRPDLDNLCKTVLDGCRGVIYVDDSQIVGLASFKDGGYEEPFVEIFCKERAGFF